MSFDLRQSAQQSRLVEFSLLFALLPTHAVRRW